MMKEYKICEYKHDLEYNLNVMAQEGWEAAAVTRQAALGLRLSDGEYEDAYVAMYTVFWEREKPEKKADYLYGQPIDSFTTKELENAADRFLHFGDYMNFIIVQRELTRRDNGVSIQLIMPNKNTALLAAINAYGDEVE